MGPEEAIVVYEHVFSPFHPSHVLRHGSNLNGKLNLDDLGRDIF
jgi:hypothetical protein